VHEDTVAETKISLSTEEEREWKELFVLREQVLAELEKARQSKLIGKSLDAKVTLSGKETQIAVAQRHAAAFRELLNASQLELRVAESDLRVVVAKADGSKCERCWHWETDVGKHAEHPMICGRCVEAVNQVVPA
jgi:isoleucyl-tRNA synthetase